MFTFIMGRWCSDDHAGIDYDHDHDDGDHDYGPGGGHDSTQLSDPDPHPYKSQDDQDDLFPSGWALGQGTDPFGLPFLTVSRIENIFILFNKFKLIVSSCITFLTVNRTQHYKVSIVKVDFCFTYLLFLTVSRKHLHIITIPVIHKFEKSKAKHCFQVKNGEILDTVEAIWSNSRLNKCP